MKIREISKSVIHYSQIKCLSNAVFYAYTFSIVNRTSNKIMWVSTEAEIELAPHNLQLMSFHGNKNMWHK